MKTLLPAALSLTDPAGLGPTPAGSWAGAPICASPPGNLTDDVLALLEGRPTSARCPVSHGISVASPGATSSPRTSREGSNDPRRLRDLGVHRCGTVLVEQVETWLSHGAYERPGSGSTRLERRRRGLDAGRGARPTRTPNSTGLPLLRDMAALLAGIAIILGSAILTVGAMVLGPEFGAIA